MPGYRVCLDCDHQVPSRGDFDHKMQGDVLVGCEGYRHRETENAIREFLVTPEKVLVIADKVTEDWVRECNMGPSEDYSDAFAYIADLYNYIAMEMMVIIYRDDTGHLSEEINADLAAKFDEADEVAEQAIFGLVPFGINIVDW